MAAVTAAIIERNDELKVCKIHFNGCVFAYEGEDHKAALQAATTLCQNTNAILFAENAEHTPE